MSVMPISVPTPISEPVPSRADSGLGENGAEISERSSAPIESLVAPVKIGKGAYIGSGSVITSDIPVKLRRDGRGARCKTNREGGANGIAR